MQGGLPKLLLHPMTFGDVAERSRHAHRSTIAVGHHHAPAERPSILAVTMTDAVLVLEMAGLPGAVRSKGSVERTDIVEVDATEPFIRAGRHLVGREPQDRSPPR